MTRSTLQRTLWRVYATIVLVLPISLIAKFVDHIPVLRTSGLGASLKDVYEYLRDMSLLIATGGSPTSPTSTRSAPASSTR